MPAIESTRTAPRRFVTGDIDATETAPLAELYDTLDAKSIDTRDDLEAFILDWEELTSVIREAFSSAYVDMSSDTTDPDYEARYLKIIENVLPLSEQRGFNLKQKMIASPALEELGDDYAMFLRNVRSEVKLFREENVPLQTEELKLSQEFDKIVGSQVAEFRGEKLTLPQVTRFLDETDRATREEAWRGQAAAKLADAGRLDDLFDKLYEVRGQIARNAGFGNYRDYKFEELKRFDYTPEECVRLHGAIEKNVVPVLEEERERRRLLLGIDSTRPWDTAIYPNDSLVDPEGREPLRPFESVQELQEKCLTIFGEVDPEFGEFFNRMIREKLLDLENRPGKAPGGYMTDFTDKRVPFIFMNAVGTKRDVETMLHEGGHAFHYFLASRLPLASYHSAGMEFSEVASTSMELLARPYLGQFYSEEEIARLLDEQVRSSLRGLPWIAMIDAFQQWLYTSEEHGAQARRAKWSELEARFRPGIDWSGLEEHRGILWQYPHVFSVPFYYIEYGIAQVAALGIWLNSLEDERGAVESYKQGLSLGGSRPLPELFKTAGVEFAFDDAAVSRVVRGALAQLKAS